MRFNADNFALANLREKLRFLIDTTAYETDLQILLGTVDTASYFVYTESQRRPFWRVSLDAQPEGYWKRLLMDL